MQYFFCIGLAISGFLVCGQSPQAERDVLRGKGPDSAHVAACEALVRFYAFKNYDSAVYYAAQGRSIAVRLEDPGAETAMLRAWAQVNEHHGHLAIARDQYQEAREISMQARDTAALAAAINGLGVIAGRTGRYEEATRYFLTALDLFQQTNNMRGVMLTYNKLGVISDDVGNLDQALTYYQQAARLNKAVGNAHTEATLLNNIGVIYGRRDDLRTALGYFREGLRVAQANNLTAVNILLLSSVGLAYDKLGMPDSAWYFQQQALSDARASDMPEPEARALLNLAALVKPTDPAQSLDLLASALGIAESISHPRLMTEIYAAMILVYKDQGDYRQALALTETYEVLKDSLVNVQKAREIAELTATQELARKQHELKTLEIRSDKSILQRNIMIGVSLATLVVLVVVWYYNRKIRRLNTALIRNQRALKESNILKDKLFSILGHDLRSPMNRVIGLLNVLDLHNRSAEEKDIIQKLRHQSLLTLETLDNLLAWGRRQLKGMGLHPQTIRAREQLRSSVAINNDYALHKGVTVINEIPDDLWIQVDPTHFEFVVRNLLSNAIKFSHAGGTVVMSATVPSDDHVVFRISDSGVGIPKERTREIFKAGASSARGTWNEKGTGIALMLCREYVTQNGGHLWVESEEGQGATFFFSLKRMQALQPEPA